MMSRLVAFANLALGLFALALLAYLGARTRRGGGDDSERTVVRIGLMYGVLGVAVLLTTITLAAVLPGGGSPVLVSALVALIVSLTAALWAGREAAARLGRSGRSSASAALGSALGHILMLEIIAVGLLVGVVLVTSLDPLPELARRLSDEEPSLQLAALLAGFLPAGGVAAASAHLSSS